jgi:hypothetical protein
MKKVLKKKKTLKKLDRVEALLSKVIDRYPADELGVREWLESARSSVGRAQAKVKLVTRKSKPASGASAKGFRTKARKGVRKRLVPDGRAPLSKATETHAVPIV